MMNAVNDFPLFLDLTGRRVLVVGGGMVAARRVTRLLDAGAVVEVVAARMSPDVALLRDPALHLTERSFHADDLDGSWLVYACTDDPVINAQIAARAEASQVFCIRADEAAGGTARTPAVLRRGELSVAITSGDDPQRSMALRETLALALDLGTLTSRPVRNARVGSVMLVGGGPGDPELITVRGRRAVAEADVVVVDRLAPRELLADLPDEVEIIDCGKQPHRHNLSQQEINEILVARATEGKRVVRLKGGDPFVFGRGSEELAACVAAGIPVQIVPGISSALAAAAAAQIPLTHRGVSADFAVISGHLDPQSNSRSYDWDALAHGPATIVLLMGVEHLAEISAQLIAHGRDGQTPAVAIHRATLPEQRIVRSTLEKLALDLVGSGVGAPAVIVIGEVAGIFD